MKTNAIIRIIIWSLVLVLLIGIFGVGMYRPVRRLSHDAPAETAVPVPIAEDAFSEETQPMPPAYMGSFALDPNQVRKVEIEWAAGNIYVQAADVDTVQISESQPSKPEYTMVWNHSNEKLSIRFCDTVSFSFGINLNDVIAKDLTILVPMDFELDTLEVDAASATLDVKNLVIREVDFDGASGTCDFENCVIDQLDLDTASGDIYFSGSLDVLDCDAASANVTAVVDNIPSRIEMDSMSGDLDITLPSDAGFAVTMDGMNSAFHCDFDYAQRNGCYYRGDEKCQIHMNALSGNVHLRHHMEAGAAKAPSGTSGHIHSDSCTTNPSSCPDRSTTHHTEQSVHSEHSKKSHHN